MADQYATRGIRRVLTELGGFAKNAGGNFFSPGFLCLFIPLLLLWEALPRLGLVPESLLPRPSTVAAAFWNMLLRKDLALHVLYSLGRFFAAFGIAVLLAVPTGLLMGWNPKIRAVFLPLWQLLSPIPPPAWVPMTIIIFGIGSSMHIFLMVIGIFYPVLFNTYQGVKDTDPRYLASARVFGASEFTLLRNVYFWHAFGAIIMSLKTGVAMGLVMLVIGEAYGGRMGVGFLLGQAKDYFLIPDMMVCMGVLGFIGWFLIEILKYVEIKLAVWKVGR
ncbi:MAG: ABC transporter permease [Deltaproteobacteria bacterium]|jgi:ABC-type nitrate/sulfonate/bicarbonate transport system permease component|nr:ABC transporter permease [Deltaproteobacteria bacterium]